MNRTFSTLFTLLALVFLSGCGPSETDAVDPYAALPRPDADNGDIQLPDDFGALVVIDTIGRGRHLAVRDNGDIYLRLRRLLTDDSTGIAALRDTSGDGKADIIESFGIGTGTEVVLHDGYIYYSSPTRVYRQPLPPGQLLPEARIDTMIYFPDSTARGHSSKSFTFDDQGNIYVNIGSRSNACQQEARTKGSPGIAPCPEDTARAAIWKFDAGQPGQTQEDGTPYAIGIRNTVGLDWNHASNSLYAMQHGRDDLNRFWPDLYTEQQSRELPAEEFLLVEEGDDFGWPYCHWDQFQAKKILNPEYGGDGQKQGRCEGIKPPLIGFPGHMGPNALLFYTGDLFPERYRNGAFIAFHGSWNRLGFDQAGFMVAFVPMADGVPAGEWEIFATGFVGPEPVENPGNAEFRPCGLAQGPDGSLYVSDSQQGRIWRIMYYGEGSGITSRARQIAARETTGDDAAAELTGPMTAGQQVYDTYCRACHMDNGMGVPGMNPPLAGTDWVNGDKGRLIGVVLNGINEPIEIKGETYQNAMAAHAFLDDRQIADVLTYIRGSFGNEAGPVSAEEVAEVRAAQRSSELLRE